MGLSNLLLLFLFALMVGAAVFISWKVHSARVAAWAEFARRHGMSAHGLHISGDYEGHPLQLETERRGSGKNRYTVTVLRLSLQAALPSDFSLSREGLGDKVLKFFGHKDAELGDEDFDKHFDLENLSPETTRVLRHPSVKRTLYEVADFYRAFRISGGWLHAEKSGTPSSVEALEELTGPALLLAHTLEESARRSGARNLG